jgi:hypothetical protein
MLHWMFSPVVFLLVMLDLIMVFYPYLEFIRTFVNKIVVVTWMPLYAIFLLLAKKKLTFFVIKPKSEGNVEGNQVA